ncbi:unnamed protein product [Rhizoctonia solani]|uniref:Uncharacterized protein n=1 Tax=Rhizoctonia solani TaxID=456999 RepID=A0A8H2WS51_9AGAM|nr:unnamed protein product [Rhizoctonia solani]
MPSLPELGSHLSTPLSVPSRRQFFEPDVIPANAGPARTTTVPVAISYTPTLVPTATTATYSAVNSHSLVIDPTPESGSNAKSATPTLGTTTTASIEDNPNSQSTADKLFTPNGGLFAVGIVIIGLAVLTLLTCAIVTIRCTLRNRRRSRTRSRVQSFTEKNVARRKISADRASEFWSAGANEPPRRLTQWGDAALEGIDPPQDGQHPPTRPARSGEAEADLRAPGRVHFTPSVAMSDYTGLSVDVQPHGSARSSGANMDTNITNPASTNSASVLPKPVVAEPINRHMSTATKFTTYTLDQDPFAASPMMPVPTTANPLLSPTHAMTFPPYAPNTPHTSDPFVVSSPQFAANFSSSPSNIATLGSSPSDRLGLGSSLGSSNMFGLSSPSSNIAYVPANTIAPLGTPTSGVMYKSGLDSPMSDPFAYDTGVRSSASTLGGTPHLASFPSPGVTWTDVNLGVASPPALHIERTSPGIQTSPLSSPYLSSPSPRSDSHLSSPAPTFQTLQPSLLSLTPPQPPLPVLQSDVSQALTSLRRRMSDSTVTTRHSQQTDYQYRPTLGAISDDNERNSSFFMYSSPGSPSRPVSLPFVPRLRISTPVDPETHQMQPTRTNSAALQDGNSVYSSPASMVDGYHQSSGGHSGLRFGSGTHAGSSPVGYGSVSGLGLSVGESEPNGPTSSNSVRTSVLSFYGKDSNV